MATIVSAYFDIPSKQPASFYAPHVKRFLQHLEAPLVFFTSANLLDVMRQHRAPFLDRTVFVCIEPREFRAFEKFGVDFWERQATLDMETYHTPLLAAVWYEKKEFVLRAIQSNPFNSEVFVWCDAGCVRDEAHAAHLKTFGTRSYGDKLGDRIVFQQIEPFSTKDLLEYPDVCIAGAIFAGRVDAWPAFVAAYDATMLTYVQYGVCCNSDQYIMATLARTRPDLVHPILMTDARDLPAGVDRWFFFLSYL